MCYISIVRSSLLGLSDILHNYCKAVFIGSV
jgi:hypothetical protein